MRTSSRAELGFCYVEESVPSSPRRAAVPLTRRVYDMTVAKTTHPWIGDCAGDDTCLRRLRVRIPVPRAGHDAAAAPGRRFFRYVYRYFPLREIHPHAADGREAAESVSALADAKPSDDHDSLSPINTTFSSVPTRAAATATGRETCAPISSHGPDTNTRSCRAGRAERPSDNGVEGTPVHFHQWRAVSRERDEGSLARRSRA